jgi:hypothetical protein
VRRISIERVAASAEDEAIVNEKVILRASLDSNNSQKRQPSSGEPSEDADSAIPEMYQSAYKQDNSGQKPLQESPVRTIKSKALH